MVKKGDAKLTGFRKYNVNMPMNVAAVMEDYVEDQHDAYPKYSPSDLLRMATVHYLKFKRYLDQDKRYL